MNQPDLVVFDGDDTLWRAEELYDRARDLAGEIAKKDGLDKKAWTARQKEIDLRNFETLGLSPQRFPKSCVEAYLELAKPNGTSKTAEKILTAAQTVFSATARNFPGSFDVVSHLSSQLPVVLLTKGDSKVQEKRVDDCKLRHLFFAVYIVEQKTAQTFLEISERLNATRPWSVGNSYPSDIKPALEANYVGIWVDAPVWQHERRSRPNTSDSYIELDSLEQVLELYRSTCI